MEVAFKISGLQNFSPIVWANRHSGQRAFAQPGKLLHSEVSSIAVGKALTKAPA